MLAAITKMPNLHNRNVSFHIFKIHRKDYISISGEWGVVIVIQEFKLIYVGVPKIIPNISIHSVNTKEKKSLHSKCTWKWQLSHVVTFYQPKISHMVTWSDADIRRQFLSLCATPSCVSNRREVDLLGQITAQYILEVGIISLLLQMWQLWCKLGNLPKNTQIYWGLQHLHIKWMKQNVKISKIKNKHIKFIKQQTRHFAKAILWVVPVHLTLGNNDKTHTQACTLQLCWISTTPAKKN